MVSPQEPLSGTASVYESGEGLAFGKLFPPIKDRIISVKNAY
jgi:hypothetical protein